MSTRLTLDEFGSARHLHAISEGRYVLEYHDSTHLQQGEWLQLAHVDVSATPVPLAADESEQFYLFTPAIGAIPGGQPAQADSQLRVIQDTLALALGRLGMLTPEMTPELLSQLVQLGEEDGVVIVPDTNALHNGAIHWLLRVLKRPSVWLLPVVASLTTIQTRDAAVKALVNKRKITNLGQALRSRGLVNGALGLLQRNRGRCQVVEIDPSLLRYQKMASSNGSDPDQSDVLEDRLIIEAIHSVLRSMRSRTARRVVTSDVAIARVLDAEGIETLFVPTIVLGTKPIECLRFDVFGKTFVGAPLRALLWELAHAFGAVRLRRDETVLAHFECYWPAKTPSDWSSEALQCEINALPAEAASLQDARVSEANTAAAKPGELRAVASTAEPLADAKPSRRSTGIVKDDRAGRAGKVRPRQDAELQAERATSKLPEPRRAPEISTPLPRASFPQVLRLLGSARRLNSGTAEDVVLGLGEGALTVDNARRGLEILRRASLLEQRNELFRPTPDADILDAALAAGDLDAVSSLIARFEPYRLLLEALRERGMIRKDDVVSTVKSLVGQAGTYESERLPKFHTLLGQAWTTNDAIYDGSNRPTDRDASDSFEEAFAAVSSNGIASVRDLLPRFCEATRMSPWAAKRQIEKFVAERLLPQYTFQPAAGGKPLVRDEVVKGRLDDFILDPVVIDRLHFGQRPVFTIEGPVR